MPKMYLTRSADEDTGDPYLDLAAAIILGAIEDYRHMKKKGHDTENGLDAEQFILSDWFTVLSLNTIDGRELLDSIDAKFG